MTAHLVAIAAAAWVPVTAARDCAACAPYRGCGQRAARRQPASAAPEAPRCS